MTSIKIFKNADSQHLENDVNKFLKGYEDEDYTTSVSLGNFTKNESLTFLAVVTIQKNIPPVNVETADTK